ncbi:hypothetical protein B0H14DRAFT_2610497 [Mycena olivaceomarginata]|nr:hypothetical protein B0H14DRAFT_2610497 [Mycena olivaceomarginata]
MVWSAQRKLVGGAQRLCFMPETQEGTPHELGKHVVCPVSPLFAGLSRGPERALSAYWATGDTPRHRGWRRSAHRAAVRESAESAEFWAGDGSDDVRASVLRSSYVRITSNGWRLPQGLMRYRMDSLT